MGQDRNIPPRPGGIWPGVVAPLGLSALLGVAITFFCAKVDADRKRAADAIVTLEQYARMEAAELAGRSRELARTLVEERTHNRRNRQSNLRMEVRGVMEAVNTFLSSSLEKSRAGAVRRRDVGNFPSGFEGVKSYLELSAAKSKSDPHVEALRASAPELAMLLPAGASLSVVENNYREILALGGGASADATVSESMTRDFFWDDGGRGRHWALHLRISASDDFPPLDPEAVARHLHDRLGGFRMDQVVWHGWVTDGSGRPVASFSGEDPGEAAGTGQALFFPAVPTEWTPVGENRFALLERSPPIPGQDYGTAVSVIIDLPREPGSLSEELLLDRNWSATLGALALFSIFGWVWFFRTMRVAHGAPSASPRSPENAPPPRRRLVRDGSGPRAVPPSQNVILAEIDDEGEVTVEAVPHTLPAGKPRYPIPTGSLHRLQTIHRGGKNLGSSRALDGARSQVLRELAARVRPALRGGHGAEDGGGKTGHVLETGGMVNPFAQTPHGWERVE